MDINIIIGPPCAGKSTHIEANSTNGDVLIDYDAIATAIGSNQPHSSDGSIRTIALRLRSSAITKIISGIKSDSWIIHTNPSESLISDYIDAGAIFTILDPGKDVCKDRAKQDNRPDGTIEAIDKWYESPPKIPDDNLIVSAH